MAGTRVLPAPARPQHPLASRCAPPVDSRRPAVSRGSRSRGSSGQSSGQSGQIALRRTAIPISETQHQLLADLRVRSRRIAERLDAALVVLRERAILIVGCAPDLDESPQIVIDTLHGILVNDPRSGDSGLERARRPRLEEEAVVACDVVEPV